MAVYRMGAGKMTGWIQTPGSGEDCFNKALRAREGLIDREKGPTDRRTLDVQNGKFSPELTGWAGEADRAGLES